MQGLVPLTALGWTGSEEVTLDAADAGTNVVVIDDVLALPLPDTNIELVVDGVMSAWLGVDGDGLVWLGVDDDDELAWLEVEDDELAWLAAEDDGLVWLGVDGDVLPWLCVDGVDGTPWLDVDELTWSAIELARMVDEGIELAYVTVDCADVGWIKVVSIALKRPLPAVQP